jgi:hypothetical protein
MAAMVENRKREGKESRRKSSQLVTRKKEEGADK